MTDLDTEALAAFLDAELGPGALAIEGRGAGYSNETLFVRWGSRELVVRRPPPDETAEGAHEVLREYRVLDALSVTDPSMLFSTGMTPRSTSPSATASTIPVTDSRNSTSSTTARAARWE